MKSDVVKIQADLAAPFRPDEVEWKAQTTKENRALAVAYIDARCVMDRLDAVVGVDGWQDAYDLLPDGNVVCHLQLRLDGEWITKTDVGGESDQKDMGDKRKAAFSDALKRVAVKFGIGRYLYSLPAQWVDYDPQRRQLKGTPRLPDWALPQTAKKPAPAPAPAPVPAHESAEPLLPGGMTRKQHADLIADYVEVGGDPANLCEKYQVGATEEIPVAKLDGILKAINKRRKENEAAAATAG